MRKNALGLGLLSASLAATASAGEIHPDLQMVLDNAQPNQHISVLVYMADQVDVRALHARLESERQPNNYRNYLVVTSLQAMANATQAALTADLEAKLQAGQVRSFTPLWIINGFAVEATPDQIRAIAARQDVGTVYYDYEIEVVSPVGDVIPMEDGGNLGASNPEPGIRAINADDVWAMGITGEGVLVANMDTGVDGNHPALRDRWAGVADPRYNGNPQWAWYDPYLNRNDFPYDNGGHGTHTLGTVCGGPPGLQIGVAHGSNWISAAPIDRGGGIPTTVQNAIRSFQWFLDPDGNPQTSWDVPASVSNSWRLSPFFHGYPRCDITFHSYLDACHAAGIAIIFSAGNEGPQTRSMGTPPDRALNEYLTFSVGATDGNNQSFPIASFSSRGPANCTPNGQDTFKPEISAPGVNVNSALPGGRYGALSGTSMASPHVNGVYALMRQANPRASVEEIFQVMMDTALDRGPQGMDNDYGAGQIDALAAVMAIMESDCPADLNEDGNVDGADFLLFLDLFFFRDPRADLDDSGRIDGNDFLLFLGAFFEGC